MGRMACRLEVVRIIAAAALALRVVTLPIYIDIWLCPRIQRIDSEDIQESQYFVSVLSNGYLRRKGFSRTKFYGI